MNHGGPPPVGLRRQDRDRRVQPGPSRHVGSGLLGLQRTAGNSAVATLVQRQQGGAIGGISRETVLLNLAGEATEDLVILFVDAVEPASPPRGLRANPAHGRKYSAALRVTYRDDVQHILMDRFRREAAQGDMGMARHAGTARQIGASPATVDRLSRLVREQAAAPGSDTRLKATGLADLVIPFHVAAESASGILTGFFIRGGWGLSNSGAEPWIMWAGVLKRYAMAIMDLAGGGTGRIGALASPESRGTGLEEQRIMIRSAGAAWSALTVEQRRALGAPEARGWLESELLDAARRRWRADADHLGFEGAGHGSTVGPTARHQFETSLFRALR